MPNFTWIHVINLFGLLETEFCISQKQLSLLYNIMFLSIAVYMEHDWLAATH